MVLRALGSVITLLLWALAGGAVLVMLTGLLFFLTGPLLGVLSPVLVLFGMLTIARLLGRARERRAFTVVGYLEQAVRLNLPLPEMLGAAQASERGGTQLRLGDVRQAIQSGMPVAEALQNYVPELNWRQQREIAVGEQMGQLGPTLSRVHRQSLRRLRSDPDTQDMSLAWGYGAVICAFLLAALARITWQILPNYVEIFNDFEIPLPWATQLTFTWGQALGLWLLPVAIGVVMLMAGWSLWSINNTMSGVWAQIPAVDRLLSWVPGLGRAMRDQAYGTGYAATADALTAGYAVPEALRLASDTALTSGVRGKLVRMADAIDHGSGFAAAAGIAKLPAFSKGLLSAVDAGGNAQQTFIFLSRYHAGRFARTLNLIKAGSLPVAVIAMSLAVGWFAYSLFLPLVSLMYSVTPYLEAI